MNARLLRGLFPLRGVSSVRQLQVNGSTGPRLVRAETLSCGHVRIFECFERRATSRRCDECTGNCTRCHSLLLFSFERQWGLCDTCLAGPERLTPAELRHVQSREDEAFAALGC